MTVDRAVVALVLTGIAGGAMAISWLLFGLINWALNLIDAWRHR